MKSLLRFGLLSALALLVVALVLGLLWWGNGGGVSDAVRITIDGEPLIVPALTGGGVLLGVGGILVAVVAVLVVVPVVLLVGLGVPVLLLTLVAALCLLAVAAGAAVALSPLVLPLLLVWWLVRRNGRLRQASTTMPT